MFLGACMFGHIQLFATTWTVALQAPLSMGFSRQEYWSGLPFPLPGDLPPSRDQTRVSCISCTGRRILYLWLLPALGYCNQWCSEYPWAKFVFVNIEGTRRGSMCWSLTLPTSYVLLSSEAMVGLCLLAHIETDVSWACLHCPMSYFSCMVTLGLRFSPLFSFCHCGWPCSRKWLLHPPEF